MCRRVVTVNGGFFSFPFCCFLHLTGITPRPVSQRANPGPLHRLPPPPPPPEGTVFLPHVSILKTLGIFKRSE